MAYPPSWRLESDPNAALELMRAHPFAHLFTSHAGQQVTRIPFVTDSENGRPIRLRGHLNADNPQAVGLNGAAVLVSFSGPHAYVSPHWRIDKARGGTIDFEQVTVHGTAHIVQGIDAFSAMIDDLSSLLEPQHADAGDYPIWQTSMAAPGYIERLVPQVTQFVVHINRIEMISKLHQQFPPEDRRSVADHLDRCNRDDSRAIAEKIRRSL
ncbi:MAG: FMN-binding negative transcriptional regulator [Phycisphaerales bacterium JB037]